MNYEGTVWAVPSFLCILGLKKWFAFCKIFYGRKGVYEVKIRLMQHTIYDTIKKSRENRIPTWMIERGKTVWIMYL